MKVKNLSTKKLFSILLENNFKREEIDDEWLLKYDCTEELQKRPTKEVFEKALELTKSIIFEEKSIGIKILSQLGEPPKPFFNETINRFFEMLDKEENEKIILDILEEVHHLSFNLENSPEWAYMEGKHTFTSSHINVLGKLKNHPNSAIRQGIANRLLGNSKKEAIDLLIHLMDDENDEVRLTATYTGACPFPFENMSDEMIEALHKRTDDKMGRIRAEAINTLAAYNDKRAKKALINEIKNFDTKIFYSDPNMDIKYGFPFSAINRINDVEMIPDLENILKSIDKNRKTNIYYVEQLENEIDELKINNGLKKVKPIIMKNQWSEKLKNYVNKLEKTDTEVNSNFITLIEGMVDFISYEDGEDYYTTNDIEKCVLILDEFIKKMNESNSKNQGIDCVKNTILKLNDLNDKCEGALIETDQRESICEIIILTSHEKGYNSKDEDITEEWRNW